jgi:septum formation protein
LLSVPENEPRSVAKAIERRRQEIKRNIILASASPRRKYLLEQLGLDFTIDPSRVDESVIPYTTHREFALKAALAKAKDVASRHKNALVIGADTIVCLDDEILGKPQDIEDARRMLLMLRGRAHIVITGVAVALAPALRPPQADSLAGEGTENVLPGLRSRFGGVGSVGDFGGVGMDAVSTRVFFKRFTQRTLERYLKSGDSLDKAGAYGIQGIGERLIHHVEGDYFNVMGLPLECLLSLLSNFMDVNKQFQSFMKFQSASGGHV